MKILFDQGTPLPIKKALPRHEVKTAFEMGWSQLQNGKLLQQAEEQAFDVFVTTDKNLRYQQSLKNRKIAILVLPTTSWPKLKERLHIITQTIEKIKSNDYEEIIF